MGPRRSSSDLRIDGLAEGTTISGKYRIERVIGEGAMGVVLSARHLELDEQVAIKFIRPEMHALPDVLSRFAREAKASAHLKSEHVAKVLDVGVATPIGPYIVMEYLDGQNLASVLQTGGPLPVRRAAEYVMQVCEALALAHASSITHRDVKPENLFLTRRGDMEIIKVLDFGISKTPLVARFLGGEVKVAETGCLMGTPLYMSPEQIRATHEVDQRTDIWSLGVVLFELLTGRPVFAGETVTQVCALVLESTPPPLLALCPRAPAELGRVIERCLEKDPQRRFQNASELANALMPFAPSRARLHAERAASVLRGRRVLLHDEPAASTMPLPALEHRASPDPSPTVFGAEPSNNWARPRSRPLVIGLASVSFLLLGFFATRLLRAPDAPPAPAAPIVPVATLREPAPRPVEPRPAPSVTVESNAAVALLPPSTDSEKTRVRAKRAVAAPARSRPAAPVSANESSANSPVPVTTGPARPEPTATARERARLIGERKQARLLE